MANFPQKRNVNVAAVNKRKHNLSFKHIGTTDFGRIKPILCKYMVPGDEFAINVLNETRVLNSMPSPTIGEFDVVYRSFFVPIAHVWNHFYDYIKNQQTIYNGSLVNVVDAPYITLKTFIDYFCNVDNGLVEIVDSSSSTPARNTYDFARTSASNPEKFYKFTRKGRVYFDFLTSLGINIPFAGNDNDSTIKLYIILPLACFWKFYFDWIVPSRFIRDHQDYIQQFIQRTSGSQLGLQSVSAVDFFTYLLHEPLAYYEDDFFTTLTEYPFVDNTNSQDNIYLPNPSISENSIVENIVSPSTSSEGFIHNGGASAVETGYFNMYTLQTLGKLQDLLNRNLIAGTKVQDWLLTEFGLKPNNDALHLSTYLGSKRHTLRVLDVISNADTEAQGGTPLGSYAGYVRNNQQFDFGYKSNEHGFYFITCELVPRTTYYQGLQSQFDMSDRFDFFQPEFDNQQGMPVPRRRLFFSNMGRLQNLAQQDTNFGFGLQYGDMKFSPDVISGDLRNRFGLSLKSWYLERDLEYIENPAAAIDGIDEEFCLVKSQYQDWHYIFSDMNDNTDPFLMVFWFDIPAMRPMKSIVEGFEPTYQQSGKEVKLDFSGSVK